MIERKELEELSKENLIDLLMKMNTIKEKQAERLEKLEREVNELTDLETLINSIEDYDIPKNLMSHIPTALIVVGSNEGMEPYEDTVVMKCGTVDACLLLLTMAQMIQSDDLEINIKGNNAKRKDYFKKLLNSHSWEKESETENI